MKNIVRSMGIVLASTFVMAGGNLSPVVPVVAEIGSPCKVQKVYVDSDTKLMWQDAPYTDAEDGAYAREHSVGKAGNWGHAVNYCRRLDYAGYTDWRLPTADELQEIHHQEGQLFVNFRDKDFWTSTPTSDGKYYVVYPADAYKYKRSKRQSNYIRCVRCVAK
ncbi:MAG: DUF1566 domain-containing protein [Sulfurovum sp.]|nr:DUF1566 domain-containing protein [Sulfurovum sp.]